MWEWKSNCIGRCWFNVKKCFVSGVYKITLICLYCDVDFETNIFFSPLYSSRIQITVWTHQRDDMVARKHSKTVLVAVFTHCKHTDFLFLHHFRIGRNIIGEIFNLIRKTFFIAVSLCMNKNVFFAIEYELPMV